MAPNPDLAPERATYADLAVSLARRGLAVSVGGFATWYQDLIAYELYAPFRARPGNFAAARVVGGEAQAEAQLGGLSVAAAYTLAFSENQQRDVSFAGKELPYHPRHRLHGRLAAALGRLAAHLDADVQSEQFVSRTNTVALPARVLADAGVGVLAVPSADLWLNLEATNLLDAQASDFTGYPLPGRAFLVVLRIAPALAVPRSDR